MMIKYRVHEVAKDLNVPNKEVLDVLQKYCEETNWIWCLSPLPNPILSPAWTRISQIIRRRERKRRLRRLRLRKRHRRLQLRRAIPRATQSPGRRTEKNLAAGPGKTRGRQDPRTRGKAAGLVRTVRTEKIPRAARIAETAGRIL